MPRGAREAAAWQAGAHTLGSPLRALPAESALAWAPVARQNGETWVGFGLLGSAVWAVRAQALTHARTASASGSGRVCLGNNLSPQLEHAQLEPCAGWCEHDPMEILERVQQCVQGAMEQAAREHVVAASEVAGVGITNQRETVVVWDRASGRPLHNAVVWHDLRTADVVKELCEAHGGIDAFRATCGLPISTYFSATKLLWLKRHVPEVAAAMADGSAMVGTIDSWLLYNLTGGAKAGGVHVTDVSNASRTMLMELKSGSWHAPTCEAFGIPLGCLPAIRSNAEVYGRITSGALAGVKLSGCVGDQQAAVLGHRCREGEAKNTYGTGCFMLLHTGARPVPSTHGLLSTALWRLGASAPLQFALEGSVATAGCGVQWLRDKLGIIGSSAEVETKAASVPDTAGVYFVPALTGLFAPHWRPDARGTLVGLTHYSTAAHICRAMLEAICFQSGEVLTAMTKDEAAMHNAMELKRLVVDGGACVNNLLMQTQADLLGVPVFRPNYVETTALGAALAAGVGAGVWTEEDLFAQADGTNGRTFTPGNGEVDRARRKRRWAQALERSLDWGEEDTVA